MKKEKWTTKPRKIINEILWVPSKESYSRVNDSKQQLNSFIIYDLDSIARVNERKKEEKKSEINKNVKKCAAEARSRAVWASRTQSRALTNWATGIADEKYLKLCL